MQTPPVHFNVWRSLPSLKRSGAVRLSCRLDQLLGSSPLRPQDDSKTTRPPPHYANGSCTIGWLQ